MKKTQETVNREDGDSLFLEKLKQGLAVFLKMLREDFFLRMNREQTRDQENEMYLYDLTDEIN